VPRSIFVPPRARNNTPNSVNPGLKQEVPATGGRDFWFLNLTRETSYAERRLAILIVLGFFVLTLVASSGLILTGGLATLSGILPRFGRYVVRVALWPFFSISSIRALGS
jgi:hypothetical protein